MKIPLLLFALLIALTPLTAQTMNCKHPNDMVEAKECAEKKFLEADAELQDTFKRLIADSTGSVESKNLHEPQTEKPKSPADQELNRLVREIDAKVRKHLIESQRALALFQRILLLGYRCELWRRNRACLG